MKLIKQKRLGQLVGLGISLLCIMLASVHAQHLTALDVVTPSDAETELHYRFDKNVQAPKSLYLKNDGVLVVDFIATGVNRNLNSKVIDNNVVADVRNLYANNKVRSTIKIQPNIAYTILHKDDEVVVTFSKINPLLSGDLITVDTLYKPPLATKDIGFYRNSQGAGVIEVFLPDDQTQVQVIDEQKKGVVLSMPSMSWHAKQVRRIEVTDYATPVSALEVVNNNGTAEVRVRTQADYEYSLQQIGNKYQLIIKPKIKLLDTKSLEGNYTCHPFGDLSFRDIDVRAVLQIIADFTGRNIVVSDSVNARITIRLKNIPCDQALDLVLRAKGLEQHRYGTIVYIAPKGEVVTGHNQIIEIFELKYTKASEIATVLQTSNKSSPENNYQSKGLSQDGNLIVSSDHNILIVRDTPEQMEIIKGLISELDKPLRQVVIQAQIIITNDSFIRELGVKWRASRLSNVELEQSRMSGSFPNQSKPKPLPRGTAVSDCGMESGCGKAGLINILRKSFNVSSELREMQENGQGEIHSSPTLMTTDGQATHTTYAFEMPFTAKDGDGNVTVEFKEVVMELKVTPNITPDDNIIMDIQMKSDDTTVNVATDKHEIKTQAIVRDGETVVIDGIFTIAKNVDKVPLLGDIPLIGNTGGRTKEKNNKTEMVIFLMPNIVR